MSFHLTSDDACTPTVKNTFINFELPAAFALSRCASAPASLNLREQEAGDWGDAKQLYGNVDSDASTDAQTEAPTCSECGTKTPMSDDNYCFEPASPEAPQTSQHESQRYHLNAGASAFQPQPLMTKDPMKQRYRQRFTELLNCAKDAMQDSEHVARIEVCDDANGWFFIVQPQIIAGDCDWQKEHVIALAQQALLAAASKSKGVYVMGYAGPKPFTMKPQGFEVILGAMENAKSACYHVFKKGFCRHGTACSKQHPVCQEAVQILVESTTLNSSTRLVGSFKQEVADLTMALMATLGSCTYADKVEAFKDKGCQGWTIEVTPKEELKPYKEYLLTLAKNALFSATGDAHSASQGILSTVYVMGYAAKPFVPKSQGFVAILGDMQDETKACWDLYSKGFCTRDCQCRWEHPECLMPISIVIKERSSLTCSPAMLEHLAGQIARGPR